MTGQPHMIWRIECGCNDVPNQTVTEAAQHASQLADCHTVATLQGAHHGASANQADSLCVQNTRVICHNPHLLNAGKVLSGTTNPCSQHTCMRHMPAKVLMTAQPQQQHAAALQLR